VLLSVLREVLDYKYKAPQILLSPWSFSFKFVLLISSVVFSITQQIIIAIVYVIALLSILLVLGLWRSTIYIITSILILHASMTLGALLLHGDLARVTRFTLVAASTLPVLVLIASTTKPSTLKRMPILYLLSIVFNNVLREILDVVTVYRARGVEGLNYWLRVIIASITLSISRSASLIDSLRSRGIEVEREH